MSLVESGSKIAHCNPLLPAVNMTPFIPSLSSSEGSGYGAGSTSAEPPGALLVGDGACVCAVPVADVGTGLDAAAHPVSSMADAVRPMRNPRTFIENLCYRIARLGRRHGLSPTP